MDFLKKQAKVEDEIFTFQISDKTTKSVTDFYREKPFPHYNKKIIKPHFFIQATAISWQKFLSNS